LRFNRATETMTRMSKRRLLCLLLFVCASGLIYYGGVMLFLVPGDVGEAYLSCLIHSRLLYGTIPFVSGLLLFALAVFLWRKRPASG
jgi:hypothetical protein